MQAVKEGRPSQKADSQTGNGFELVVGSEKDRPSEFTEALRGRPNRRPRRSAAAGADRALRRAQVAEKDASSFIYPHTSSRAGPQVQRARETSSDCCPTCTSQKGGHRNSKRAFRAAPQGASAPDGRAARGPLLGCRRSREPSGGCRPCAASCREQVRAMLVASKTGR